MIVSQTPLRVSLFGGGTDLPDYYAAHGGAVLSLAVRRYVHVVVKPRWEGDIVLHHWSYERATRVADLEHGIIRECLRESGITGGVEITCLADVPAGGSGLGASSALTVGLLHALFTLTGRDTTPAELAELASHIEIDVLGEPIGKQDQYAAAFGGCAEYRFHPDGRVAVDPVGLPAHAEREFLRHAVVLYTGRTRRAAEILDDQRAAIPTTVEHLHTLKAHVTTGRALLHAGRIAELGALLHGAWEVKKRLSSRIHDDALDAVYRRARLAGAFGGKLLGAGGGGFFLFLCPPERQDRLRAALDGLRELPLSIDGAGSTILVNTLARPAAA
ncbi:hypothetical protein ACIA8K_29365 [Catenuloplanes sp. NPDC051500]|uniref:GHMP family kinase ATP-binding protein n=1 Tax=Catenuloplanes sp. NPDC051500 TaxID=3363959 RepID=UPI0037A53E78